MKKILKIWLKKSQLTKATNDYSAQIFDKGSMDVENIIDELLNEGLEVNRELALDLIERFNRKSADLVLSGFSVNNGIVNMRPTIKGSLYGGKWNTYINAVSVSVTEGYSLRKAIAETRVEIVGENGDPMKMENLTDQITQHKDTLYTNDRNSDLRGSYMNVTAENSACGTAFRTWLFKA